uniref:J domain-containing protein n=1 Tax=Xiphophorus maculatus TaxID=8083 RepID=A0A3B5QYV1_XIPMA
MLTFCPCPGMVAARRRAPSAPSAPSAPRARGPLVLSLVLVLVRGWEADLELLDLVEEVSQNFYEFLHLDKDAAAADIKKAYRRLSLTLHPDKNKDENAETQFRQVRRSSDRKVDPTCRTRTSWSSLSVLSWWPSMKF